ncbi:hypothetical protein [Maricaulis sp. MIT060901]|uniref:hypothetical protein n=1 Tax=Maricaulis sp. MIT060901 TaxID=3096993 RepID=UPI00399B3A7D
MARKAFYLTIILAVVTLGFAGLMGQPGPLQPDTDLNGFQRPIFALYFATSLNDLHFITGAEGAALRQHLMRLQAIDTWFPLAYGGMAMAFFLALGVRGSRAAWLGLGLAAFTIGADWAENDAANRVLAGMEPVVCEQLAGAPAGQELCLTLDSQSMGSGPHVNPDDVYSAGQQHREHVVGEALADLGLLTWIKWGAIALYAAVFGAIMALAGRKLLAAFPILAAFGVAASWSSGADPAVFNWANQLLVPFMLTFPVAAVMYLRAKDESAEGDDESAGEGEA